MDAKAGGLDWCTLLIQELLRGHICLGPSVYALGYSLDFYLGTDTCSTRPSVIPEFISLSEPSFFCGQSYCILPQSIWKLPPAVSISQQMTVIAISCSQATSPQPDESEECFSHAALCLAASFAELL